MSPNLLLPEASPTQLLRRRVLGAAGTLLLVGTYLFLVITQPTGIVEGLGQGVALATFAAYLIAAILLLLAVLPDLPVSALTLIPVALALNISYETVKEHVQHILRKIGVSDRTQAAVWAVRKGLV